MESPTHVGNTRNRTSECSARSVHPHACGEYAALVGLLCAGAGSSPRVWGILFRKMQEITAC